MNRRGFTLIELLAVVLILGVLTAISVPQYRRSLERSRVAEALQMLPAIYEARERLIIEQGLNWGDLVNDDFRREKAPFRRLDIEMKGQVRAGEPTVWESPNFVYFLFAPNSHASSDAPVSEKYGVLAEPVKKYIGTQIFFDGKCITCSVVDCPTCVNGCEIFNIDKECDFR